MVARSRPLALLVVVLLVGPAVGPAADKFGPFVTPGPGGTLAYEADARGNRVPDFSHCGYGGGGVAIPDAPVRVVVAPVAGDATARIQAAIDYVAGLIPDDDGVRGAVLLLAGRHEVAGQLRISTGGVVLRGQNDTLLVATGTDRRTLIRVAGKADRKPGTPRPVADRFVPVGAYRVRLYTVDRLKVGDRVSVEHPSTKAWITALGMDGFPPDNPGSWLDWRPGTLDVRWDRAITAIDGDTISLDAPLTAALDSSLSTARVVPYTWPGRIEHVGVENLRCESASDPANPHDEQHAWGGVGFEAVRDGWVRNVRFAGFAGSAVAVWDDCAAVTVEDCESTRPVSEIGGYRRHTFYTSGQLTLFRRCKAEQGRHDFAVGAVAAGPNAFVHCSATDAQSFSGPIESWATGVLYDNVKMDGGGLALTNREIDGHGAGWAAANSVLWQCVAPVVTCRKPPTANNWAAGCWGQFVGDGRWQQVNQFAKPECLYGAQLAARLGEKVAAGGRITTEPGSAPRVEAVAADHIRELSRPAPPPAKPLALKNGWLTCNGTLVTGREYEPPWWKGQVLPGPAAEMGPAVTRFVPGRVGTGFTDDLAEVADRMQADNTAVLDHHWGLWYDRRRDDHEMIRRIDGNVWPPFYEQPWARSGQGKAWDGLSKYDLTKYNSWYFDRLRRFADECGRTGRVLYQQMYFQHNILEAGAHWADFPWRPANCLQATGFPEPPPYVGDKRVFMAEAFYDVTHPVRRALHRAYIRHCLDVLGDRPNVVFFTGAEFSGPLHFAQFWLDTVAEWQQETGRKVLVGLSATKDVQDAILADPVRGPRVSVIDLRYWWYTADGGVYNPKGTTELAPRQQLREWKGPKGRSDASVARMVREYRAKYPDKAVVCSLDGANGWAVAAAGGSIPALPAGADARLLAALPRMKVSDADAPKSRQWTLSAPGEDYLVYATGGGAVRLDLPAGEYAAFWVDPRSGKCSSAGAVSGTKVERTPPGRGTALLWVTRAAASR